MMNTVIMFLCATILNLLATTFIIVAATQEKDKGGKPTQSAASIALIGLVLLAFSLLIFGYLAIR